MSPGIVEGRHVSRDLTLTPDVCIVGSGAAGGVCALKLAEAGFDVLVLEEGPDVPSGQGHGGPGHVRPTLSEREAEMYGLLYQEGGGRTTRDGWIPVLQGRCLGGGTTVNWSACLPPPEFTLDHWRRRYGLPFTRERLRPYLVELVNLLHIHRNERYNRSARALIEGCTALGYPWSNLPNNTRSCRECGSCGVGCPYDRKQSGIVTWLPAALERGATIYTDAKVERLAGDGQRVREVQASLRDAGATPTGRTLTVRPSVGVVLAAGAIGTPAVLLRSGLTHGGLVGRFTHIHPVTACVGRHTELTFPAYGVPDNMMTEKFAEGPTGYLIETGSFFPVLSALATLDFGDKLHSLMREYFPFGAIMYAHHCSGFDPNQPYGTVRLDRYGDPELEYRLAPDNVHAMRRSLVEMTRIHLASGAKEVYHLTNPSLEIAAESQLRRLDDVAFEPHRISLFTVHVMGGCRMGSDAARSVVQPDFTLRGASNVWVVDASIFPTGLGANPQVTIYALGLWASQELCQRHGKPFTLSHQQGVELPWKGY